MPNESLPPKQSRFVEEYILDLNATQAAIRAGYSPKTAYRTGADLLKKPQVRQLIDQYKVERSQRVQMDADRVLQRLAEIDAMDVADILNDDGSVKPLRKWPRIWRTYITSFDITELAEGSGDERQVVGLLKKIKWPDKLKNLEMIGRHVSVQAWKEQRELSGNLSLSHEEALELLS
ncbi:terminase small subunit [Halomonas sp. TRM85114]|uniref:terminase small subunit n=1 Tax=Halomonas jincaotanensis TaxID=2810616 RepID=UPI001BD3AFFD|nr:terminase small subunit [Halomonas jincaotanensis]MBS9404917.1 terminase small subunit [Halomonas jincaotanensis]